MANNIMCLENSRTGHKVVIGKYYPETGWYIVDPGGFSERVSDALHFVDFGEKSYDEAVRESIPANGGVFGDTSWRIVYEYTPGDKSIDLG